MVIVLVLVVLAVVGGGIAFALSAKKKGTDPETVDIGERLSSTGASPKKPTVTPPATPAPVRPSVAEPARPSAVEPARPSAVEPARPSAVEPARPSVAEPVSVAEVPVVSSPASVPEIVAIVEDPTEASVDDEPDLSRFGVASAKPKALDIPWPTPAPTTAVRHLEVEPVAESVTAPEPTPEVVPDPESMLVVEVVPEPEPVPVAEVIPEPEPEPEPEPVAEVSPEVVPEPAVEVADEPAGAESDPSDEVIDLVADEAEVMSAAVVPEAESDPVDQVLNALINRARERRVGVAEVAAEIVEQAEAENREVDDVLADLVVQDDESDEASTRLTLFSEAVPRRPGELTQFSELPAKEKKRVIIRVLCLLVAQAEEAGRLAPPIEGVEVAAGRDGWPVARAVWPGAAPEELAEDEPVLPARR